VQIKLLQVLQERAFTPLGGHEKKRFAGRVIAATNRPLDELRRDGRFRDDFFLPAVLGRDRAADAAPADFRITGRARAARQGAGGPRGG
jgi:transcriptional regulator of acetoin/glycerol metabolism